MSYQDEISIIKLVRDTCYQPFKVNKAMTVAIQSMEKLQEYEKLGTLEEVREAVEKQKEERPIAVLGTFGGEEHECRECGNTVEYMDEYCKWCGKKLDWSEEE